MTQIPSELSAVLQGVRAGGKLSGSPDGATEQAVTAALTRNDHVFGAKISDALIAWLTAPEQPPSNMAPDWRDVPFTRMLALTTGSNASLQTIARLGCPAWDAGNVAAHAFWFSHVAPQRHGWPDPLVAPVKHYFGGQCGLVTPDIPLTRAMQLPWNARPDLQAAFDLRTARARAAYIVWLLTSGLRDLDLALVDLDRRLIPWLARPSRRLPGVPVVLELVWLARQDLQAGFDVATDAGRLGLFDWGLAHFTTAFADTALLAVDPAHTAALTDAIARSPSVAGLRAQPE